jgi:hypothetical protein
VVGMAFAAAVVVRGPLEPTAPRDLAVAGQSDAIVGGETNARAGCVAFGSQIPEGHLLMAPPALAGRGHRARWPSFLAIPVSENGRWLQNQYSRGQGNDPLSERFSAKQADECIGRLL